MKKIFIIITLVCLCGLTKAYSSETKTNQSKIQRQESAPVNRTKVVQLNAEASLTTDRKILIKGMSNLPDGSALLVSVSNATTGFMATDDSKVLEGTFSAGPFGPDTGIATGDYIIEIVMTGLDWQPNNVKTAIGNNGERLSGPLVKEDSWGSKTVEYSFPYLVGSQLVIQQEDNEHQELVSGIKKTIKELLETGKKMEQYRNTESISSAQKCGQIMRENQPVAKAVKIKSDDLSLKYNNIKTAALESIFCVSCSNTAIDHCQRAYKLLEENP